MNPLLLINSYVADSSRRTASDSRANSSNPRMQNQSFGASEVLFLPGMNKRVFSGNCEKNCQSLEVIPARLDANLTAKILGFALHDIPILVAAKLLRPLGDPAPNAPKFFAHVEIMQLAMDYKWLSRATKTVSECWREKNQKQRAKQSPVASELVK